MKVLAIGNSFSSDATRYLHKLAKANGESIKTVNLYIGGCSLERHYFNILENAKDYSFEFNGETTGIKVTVKDALMSDSWDYITVQQQSSNATDYRTYQPYLNELVGYIKRYRPHSKIIVHQTWAYEDGSDMLLALKKYNTGAEMFSDIKASYEQAYKDIDAHGLIPCGEVFMKALENGVSKIHRDTYHAKYGIGRYALALTWFAYLTGKDPESVVFNEFDETVSEKEIDIVKRSAKEVLSKREHLFFS